jgi:hypothetical protein
VSNVGQLDDDCRGEQRDEQSEQQERQSQLSPTRFPIRRCFGACECGTERVQRLCAEDEIEPHRAQPRRCVSRATSQQDHEDDHIDQDRQLRLDQFAVDQLATRQWCGQQPLHLGRREGDRDLRHAREEQPRADEEERVDQRDPVERECRESGVSRTVERAPADRQIEVAKP